MRSVKRLPAIVAVGAALIFTFQGCSSTMVGHRLGELPPDAKGSKVGIPYNLTRPVFKVTETRADGAEPAYTLGIEWITDPQQRYTLALDPALLTDAQLKMSFGSSGQLSEVNSETAQQITPTITAIGTFVTSALGAAAKAAGTSAASFDLLETNAANLAVQIDNFFGKNCIAACVGRAGVEEEKCNGLKDAWNDDFKERFKKSLDDLHLRTAKEKPLVRVATEFIRCNIKPYTNAFEAMGGDKNEFAKDVKEAAEKNLSSRLNTLEKEVKDLKPEEQDKARTLIAEARKALEPLAIQKKLQELEELSDKEWRHRHASYLESKINDLEHDLLGSAGLTDEPEKSPKLQALRLQLAATVGGLAEERRAQELRAALIAIARNEGTHGHPIGETPPMKDFELARIELEKAEQAILDRREALRPKKTGSAAGATQQLKPPSPRDLSPAVFWRAIEGPSNPAWVAECLKQPDKCSMLPWSYTPPAVKDLSKGPEFVIVVEKGVQP